MESQPQKTYKKKWGRAEGKKRSRRLKEFVAPALGCMWLKAVSKNPDEKQDGRDGLSLLFLLFEDALDLKADHDSDPLEDLDCLLQAGAGKARLIDQFAMPKCSKKAI
ncbi:MAG: hypothetical protein KGS72_26955 [Cyanobacteria bacterium REEB67]|nr:hypothetical protein [Cyanobacteria bacterium REEB67]